MNYKQHFNKTINLAVPVVLSQLGHIMVTVADSAMVGQVGTVPLAAAALAGGILHVAMLFGIGVSYGVTPPVANANGKKNFSYISILFKNGLLLNSITGLLLLLLVVSIAPVLGYMGQDQSVSDLAIPYLQITGASILPLMIFQHFRQMLEGLAITRPMMVVSILSNLINVGLNYILIFGKLGFEPMGLNGAGWATLIARIIMAIMIAVYFFWHSRFKQYWSSFKDVKIQFSEIRKLTAVGLPSGLQLAFEVSAFSFSSVMAGWIGATSQAAHQISLNVSAVTYMIATGVSASATIRVGNFLGEQNWPDLRKAGFACMILVSAFMFLCCLVFIIFNHEIPRLYISDMEVINLAGPIFIIVAFYQVSDGLQVVGLGTLRGISDVKIPTLVTVLAYWLCAIPTGYFLALQFNQGLLGIWVGLLVGLTVAGILHFLRFRKLTNLGRSLSVTH
ncbi:MAG: MATE family efflux transporter [bacterium]|nr:MATE family efflux transporter [bacterium]